MVIYNSGLGGYVWGLGGRTEELSVYGGVPDQFVILRQVGGLGGCRFMALRQLSEPLFDHGPDGLIGPDTARLRCGADLLHKPTGISTRELNNAPQVAVGHPALLIEEGLAKGVRVRSDRFRARKDLSGLARWIEDAFVIGEFDFPLGDSRMTTDQCQRLNIADLDLMLVDAHQYLASDGCRTCGVP